MRLFIIIIGILILIPIAANAETIFTPIPTLPTLPPYKPITIPTITPLQLGSVLISSSPQGANVYLDGISLGLTPIKIGNVPSGSHHLLLTMNNYHDDIDTITVNPGQTLEISRNLIAINSPPTDTPTVVVSFTREFPTTSKTIPGFEGIVTICAIIGLIIFWRETI